MESTLLGEKETMRKTGKTDFRAEKSAFYTHHIGSGYMIKGEVWLEKNGRVFIDSNRINLLSLVDKLGSLAAAARTMGLGYNSAWLWIIEMNRLSPRPLVVRSAGGINGGYSVLTEHGRRIMAEYNQLNRELKEAAVNSAYASLDIPLKTRRQVVTARPEAIDDIRLEP